MVFAVPKTTASPLIWETTIVSPSESLSAFPFVKGVNVTGVSSFVT